ncbi:alpha/beta hydrolase family protein [Pleomorphomonas oryzae]|uniref:alpha/beta hydrolase family protein n=1 Tax=Pleomorphomonas oryzae TaxID=261934 RepID=UPI00047B8B02|nr:alpha/beta hydrolase [Pleomorphomonas oryzae]
MPVGLKRGACVDPRRLSWDGNAPRPLAWTAWYPADESSIADVPLERSWFRKEPIALNAPLARSNRALPLVVLSHGTGATGDALEWLGHRLAQRGFVALAVDHHGHTGSEPYRAEGFLCMWERASDLSAILDEPSWRSSLGVGTVERVFAAGFSAGAYTALLLAGARVAFSQFEPGNPEKSPIRGPREFPNLADELPKLYENPVFRKSWDRRRSDFSDPRIRAVFAIAPGRSVLGFSQDSLQTINRPVHLIGGDGDTVAPPEQCCAWLSQNIPRCSSEILVGSVGHYAFLPEGSVIGQEAAPELFRDREGLNRALVHDEVAGKAAEFFAKA